MGIDYNETFAPTVRYFTIRALLALACSYDLEVGQFDVITAFLNANVQETILMSQPEGYEKYAPDGTKYVCKLRRALYAPRTEPDLGVAFKNVPHVQCPARLFEPRQAPQVL